MKVKALTLRGDYTHNEDVYLVNKYMSKGGGRKKHQSKNVCLNTTKLTILAVLDGVNGCSLGGACAHEAALAIKTHILALSEEEQRACDLLLLTQALLEVANDSVREFCKTKNVIAGTTINILVTRNAEFVAANIGDSETYLLWEKELLIPLSLPQTVANWKACMGEPYTQRENHILFNYLGKDDTAKDMAHIQTGILQKKDKILICSDGLSKVLDSETIFKCLSSENPMKVFKKLLMPQAKTLPDNTTWLILEN